MPRLFLAVEIPENIRNELKHHIGKFKLGVEGNFVQPRNIHITLKFLGEASPKKVVDKLSKLKYGEFNCELKSIGLFPNQKFPSVLWFGVGAGSKELGEIASQIDKVLGSLPDKEFHAHATFCRIKRAKLSGLLDLLKTYKKTSFGNFLVEELVLFESHLTPKGPVYSTVQRFRLSE